MYNLIAVISYSSQKIYHLMPSFGNYACSVTPVKFLCPLILCAFFFSQNNTGQAGGVPKLDLNVEAAWALGFTGKGVTTAIMDDGQSSLNGSSYKNVSCAWAWLNQ